MSASNDLATRLDAEFAAVEQKIKSLQTEKLTEHQGRQQRLEQLETVFTQLQGVWRPRLEVLQKKFGDKIRLTPKVVPGKREAAFNFQSNLARISLRFSASTDQEVRKLILNYDLEILPILQQFTSHSEIEFPLDAIDQQALGHWIDDRIVDFVQTYLSLGSNEYYLKDHMVEDPIAKVRFPKFAAAATLDRNGKTHYFISEETRVEFEKKPA